MGQRAAGCIRRRAVSAACRTAKIKAGVAAQTATTMAERERAEEADLRGLGEGGFEVLGLHLRGDDDG
eukprot:1621423-Rhodomonas_salina.1